MAQFNGNWDDLSRSIEDIVDRAVSSQNYQKLNQTIRQTVDQAVNAGTEAVRRVASHTSQSTPVYANQSWGLKRELPVLYSSTGGSTALGVLKTVGGGVISFSSFISTISTMILNLIVEKSAFVGFGGLLALTGLG